jgi:hypothetical protein
MSASLAKSGSSGLHTFPFVTFVITPQPPPKLLYLDLSVVGIETSSSRLKRAAAQGGIYRSASLVLPLVASCVTRLWGQTHHFWKLTPPSFQLIGWNLSLPSDSNSDLFMALEEQGVPTVMRPP